MTGFAVVPRKGTPLSWEVLSPAGRVAAVTYTETDAEKVAEALGYKPAAARGDVRAVLQEMRDRQVARRFKSQTLTDWADRIEAALAAEGVQAGEVEQQARGALKREPGQQDGESASGYALRIATAALSQQPEARGVVDVEAIRRACQSGKRFWQAGPGYYEEIESLLPALTGERNG